MLLDLFTKVQSSRIPHEVVLEGFSRFLTDNLQRDIKDTPWCDATDLMGPFTNHLPQHSLITMNLVSLFSKLRDSKCLRAIIRVSRIHSQLQHLSLSEDLILLTLGHDGFPLNPETAILHASPSCTPRLSGQSCLVDWRHIKLVRWTRRYRRPDHYRDTNVCIIRDTFNMGTNGSIMGVCSCICRHDKILR